MTKSLQLYYQPGNIIQSHPFVKGENPDGTPYGFYQAISLRYGIHTDGRRTWQQVYAQPVYGIGLYKCFISEKTKSLGNPVAIYSFATLPLMRSGDFSINWEVAFGLAFNWKQHSIDEMGYHYPIGSYASVYFDAGLDASFNLSKRLDLLLAVTYTHFSNGAVKLPNFGVNMIGGRLAVRYLFNDRPVLFNKPIPKYRKEWELFALLAPSMKQVKFQYVDKEGDALYKGLNYGILSLSIGGNRQLSYKIKLGGGADISYNSSHGADTIMVDGVPEKAPPIFGHKIMIGLFPSFELVLGEFSMIVQPGVYIFRNDTPGQESPTTYQRVGIQYHFTDHLLAGVNIRAYNFSKADFIEWVIGYRIKWVKEYRKNKGVWTL